VSEINARLVAVFADPTKLRILEAQGRELLCAIEVDEAAVAIEFENPSIKGFEIEYPAILLWEGTFKHYNSFESVSGTEVSWDIDGRWFFHETALFEADPDPGCCMCFKSLPEPGMCEKCAEEYAEEDGMLI
jgi:hypothetical protein